MATATMDERWVLYVDLDGTLVATDTLWEGLVACARRAPWALVAALVALARGRARFKEVLARAAPLEVAGLPYRRELLAFLHEERARGRLVVLATAADRSVAEAVAAHLGIFDAVLASDGTRNLKGAGKLEAVRRHAEGRPFAYAGDALADLPLWREASRIYVVAPSSRVRAALPPHRPERVFDVSGGWPRALWTALRPHQWAKNLLVFVPLALTPHLVGDVTKWITAGWAFVALSAVASAGYLVNDLLDLEADRAHPVKRHRPLASGALPIPFGLVGAGLLAAVGVGVAVLVTPPAFGAYLAAYLICTLAYSLYVKRLLMLDVLLLAGLYTLRLLAGGAALDIELTPWLLAFSMFLFLGLAFAKRYAELQLLAGGSGTRASGRAYRIEDLDLVAMLGTTSAYLSVLVMCLYINSEHVGRQYPAMKWLWFEIPLLLYWVSRIWFLAKRGELPGDPVAFAVRDPVSWGTGALMALVVVLAAR